MLGFWIDNFINFPNSWLSIHIRRKRLRNWKLWRLRTVRWTRYRFRTRWSFPPWNMMILVWRNETMKQSNSPWWKRLMIFSTMKPSSLFGRKFPCEEFEATKMRLYVDLMKQPEFFWRKNGGFINWNEVKRIPGSWSVQENIDHATDAFIHLWDFTVLHLEPGASYRRER